MLNAASWFGYFEPRDVMDFEELTASERLALSQICWPNPGADAFAMDQNISRLQEKGLACRSSNGAWMPTAYGRFFYACIAIGLKPPT